MHDGELGAGQSAEGYLITGLGVEDVSVVDVRLVRMQVVIAKDVFSSGEVRVVAKAGHADSTGRRTVKVTVLGDFQEEPVSAKGFAPQDYPVVSRIWEIKPLKG